jgi:transcriptional regulator with XRE-family HTH domain
MELNGPGTTSFLHRKGRKRRAGLSLGEAASAMDLSISMLSRYESGTRDFSKEQIVRLQKVLLEALEKKEIEERRLRMSAEVQLAIPDLLTKFSSMSGQTVPVTVGREAE